MSATEAHRAVTLERGRVTAAAIILLLALSHAIPFWWGMPTQGKDSWAFDEIPPSHSGDDVLQRHGGRYPPLHYWLLKAAYSPVRLAGAAGLVDLAPTEEKTWLRASGRLLSVLMAAGTMVLLVRLGRRLFPESQFHGTAGPGWMLAWLVGLSPVYVFYAKMVNLDVPYIFWFVASLLAYLRILERHELRDYLVYGLLAAAAICTKDQAFALYVLPSIWLPFALARWRGDGLGPRAALASLLDRRLLLGAGLGLFAFLLIHNVFFDPSELREHLRVMLGRGSQPNRGYFEPTPAGHLGMAWLAVRHVAFILGLPACAAAAYGLALAWRRRLTPALVLLLFPLSSYLFFIVPILFHRDRYLLPSALVVACFAALGLATFAAGRQASAGGTGRRPWGRWIVVGLVLLHVLARGWWINLAMLNDARYEAEEWIDGQRAAGRSVAVFNNQPPRAPRTAGRRNLNRLQSEGPNLLRRLDADYIVISPEEAADRGATEALDRLHDGSYGYQLEREFKWRPEWDLLPRWRISSNLPKINPRWLAFGRDQLAISGADVAAWLQGLWAGELDDWDELGRRLRASPLLPGRRTLAPGLVAINLRRDGWTRDTRPALLVFHNSSATERPARVLLRPGPRERLGAVAIVRGAGGERRVLLDRARHAVDLASVPPGATLSFAIAAEEGFEVRERGRERRLGVQVLAAEPARR